MPRRNPPNDLPPELIFEIINHLSSVEYRARISTLASCCLVSKAFKEMAIPQLYKRIDMTHVHIQVKGDPTRAEDLSLTAQAQIPQSKYFEKYAKLLTIDSGCPSRSLTLGSSINLLNLETLQIKLAARGCAPQRFHPSDIAHVASAPSTYFLLDKLRPKNLVIRNISARLINFHLPTIPLEVYENVETLVLISSSYEKYQPSTSPLVLPNIPNLTRVYWLFDPPIPERREVAFHKEWYKVNVWGITQLILSLPPSVGVSIVNVGSTILKDPNHRYMSVERRQREVERNLWDEVRVKSRGQPYCWNTDEVEERMGTVKFLDLEDFVGNEQWWDWLDVGEVGSWKRIMSNLRN